MPIFYPNPTIRDPRDMWQNPRDPGPVPGGPFPPGGGAPIFNPGGGQQPVDKAPPQYAGPVQRGPSGTAQPQQAGPIFQSNRTSLLDLPIFGGGGNLPRDLGPNFSGPIAGEISNTLMGMDPFPPELVPPFRVEDGLVQQDYSGNPLFDLSQSGFDRAQGFGAQAGQANVNLDQFGATTRQVSPDELVSNQLTQLLDDDSRYMQNATRRGERAAAARGGLSSSVFAGASQRAAIEAGLPIASADAQAFMQAASQNMQAQNQMTLAKLDSTTRTAMTNAQLATQAAIASAQNRTSASQTNADLSSRRNLQLLQFEGQRMLADSRERLAETQLNAQFSMQQMGFGQEQFMETLRQQGRVDLTQLDGRMRAALAEMGMQHEFDMSNLSQAQRIEIQERFTQPNFQAEMDYRRAMGFSNVMMQGMQMYNQVMVNAMGQETDAAGVERAMQAAMQGFEAVQQLAPLFLNGQNWSFPDF